MVILLIEEKRSWAYRWMLPFVEVKLLEVKLLEEIEFEAIEMNVDSSRILWTSQFEGDQKSNG